MNNLIHCRNRIWKQFTGHSIWQAAETAGILCEIQYQQVSNWTKNCCRCIRASLILSHLDPFCCLVSSVISSRFTAAGLLAARRSALCLSSSPLLSFLTSGRLQNTSRLYCSNSGFQYQQQDLATLVANCEIAFALGKYCCTRRDSIDRKQEKS